MLINTFVMCHSQLVDINEVDPRTSNYSLSLDLSGKKYDNCINAFIPDDSTCPYVSKFMQIQRDDNGDITHLELNANFTNTIQLMLAKCGSLYFIDTINGGQLLIDQMELLGFKYTGETSLTVSTHPRQFMRYIML